ncbi:MAG: Ig-like domain-containing protein, partial [Candidatus Muiribacteriota bacterium]
MKKSCLLLIFLLIFIYSASAFVDIKGYIINEKEQPIFDFIEIALNETKIITGDSKYEFLNMPPGEYVIKVNSPESRNHNVNYSSYENKFSVTNENGKPVFWNYSPKVVLTPGKTWNFRPQVRDFSGNILSDASIKLYSIKNGSYYENFSNIPTGSYRIIINDPFSEHYKPSYDFTEIENRRSMLELTIGTFNENIIVYSYAVWKDYVITYSTQNKNIGAVIEFNQPGSPINYNLPAEQIPPWVIKSWPVSNQTMFSIRDRIRIIFSEDIIFDANVKNKVLVYSTEKRQYIELSMTYDTENKTIIATPRQNLDRGAEYTLIVSNISDKNNNLMKNDYRINFYTETSDFEDFNHKYLVRNVTNLSTGQYEPPTQGERSSLVSTELTFVENREQPRETMVMKRPEMTILLPIENQYYSADFVPQYKMSDIEKFTINFYVDSKEIPLNFRLTEEGTKKFAAKFFDADNRLISAEYITYTLDKTKPVIKITPELESVNYFKTYNGEIEVIDDNLDTVKITVNGEERRRNIILNEDGTYILKISATDKSNNITEKSYEIIIDNTPPVIIAKVENKEIYKSPFDLSIGVIEDNIDELTMSYNGAPLDVTDLIIETEGRHNIKVMAKDLAGNLAEINKTFEVYFDQNYNEIQKFKEYKSMLAEVFTGLEKISNDNGEFYMERLIMGLCTTRRQEAQVLPEFNQLSQLFSNINIPGLNPAESSQIKNILMYEKYWTFPRVSEYIRANRMMILKTIENYSFMHAKFNEMLNIINIASGNLIAFYENEKETNDAYFEMYYNDYLTNIERMAKLGSIAPELKTQMENTLANLYFGKKMLSVAKKSSPEAISDMELRKLSIQELTNILTAFTNKDFSKIANMVKDASIKQPLVDLGRALARHQDLAIINQKIYPLTKSYFALNVSFALAGYNFNIEFWYEYQDVAKLLRIDHISNINNLREQISKIQPIFQPVSMDEKKSPLTGVLIIIVLLLLFVISGVGYIYYKKMKKKKEIEETYSFADFEEETNDEIVTMDENQTSELIEKSEEEKTEIEKEKEAVETAETEVTEQPSIETIEETPHSDEEGSDVKSVDKKDDFKTKITALKENITEKIEAFLKKFKGKSKIRKQSKKVTTEETTVQKESEIELESATINDLYSTPLETVLNERKSDLEDLKTIFKLIEDEDYVEQDEPVSKPANVKATEIKHEISLEDDIDLEIKPPVDNKPKIELSEDDFVIPGLDEVFAEESTEKDKPENKTQVIKEGVETNTEEDDIFNIKELENPKSSTDEMLESILDELETEDDTQDINKENDEIDPFNEAINDLKTSTPKELIDMEKEEIASEKLVEDLGIGDI